MDNKIVRWLIEVEIRLGFLSIPARGFDLMPEDDTKIPVTIDGERLELRYNAHHKRIFGLTAWYKKNKVVTGDKAELEKTGDFYVLRFGKFVEDHKQSENIVDLSGLSTQAKGNVVEERIKELVVLQGQGLLNVYRPVIDNQGIDMIVVKNGVFQPIFLQVKSRFNMEEAGNFLIDINKKTMTPHHSFF